ncbi:MAG TPA: hypothetical protein VMG55_09600 [Stellaceae bacterium]|nr:hypothetical protein [Stellaceae bacterium]
MKMKAPAGCRQVSHDGCDYAVDEDGIVEVPGSARAALEAHGFTCARETPKRRSARATKSKE